MTGENILLTGIPRGGTTLSCRMLGDADNCVALFEPMPVHELSTQPLAAVQEIADYFSHVRRRALQEGRVPTKHRQGRVPDNCFAERVDSGSPRALVATLGEIEVNPSLTQSFRLVIKHNSAFAALLPALVDHFRIIGIVRNPLAVLASWHSVDLPVSHGRLPAGERLDPSLAHRLQSQPDVLRRQVIILDWFFERFQRWLPATRLLRYEEIIASDGRNLVEAAGIPLGQADIRPLSSHNANSQYDPGQVVQLMDVLHDHAQACWETYGMDEVEALARTMLGRTGND